MLHKFHIEGFSSKKFFIAMLSLLTVVLAPPLQAAPEPEKSLYERLGGVFAIAAVVDHFSDAVVKNPIVGITSKNPALREWHTKKLDRLPGLKFMRTLWVCEVAGGPFKYSATRPGKTELGLEEAHRDLRISPDEFDEVASELGRTLDFAKVPPRRRRSPRRLRCSQERGNGRLQGQVILARGELNPYARIVRYRTDLQGAIKVASSVVSSRAVPSCSGAGAKPGAKSRSCPR